MTNKIGYNQLPNKQEFIKLYKEYNSQQKLANYYQCTKKRIQKWLIHFDLPVNKRGGGNNWKFDITKEELKKLVEAGWTNKEIAIKYGSCKSNIAQWLMKYKITRRYDRTEFARYNGKVRTLTEANYVKFKEILNPNKYPRTLCGVVGGYQLDHIMGVKECFMTGVSPEKCSEVSNLQLIPWQENLKKRKYGVAK